MQTSAHLEIRVQELETQVLELQSTIHVILEELEAGSIMASAGSIRKEIQCSNYSFGKETEASSGNPGLTIVG